MGTRHNVVFMYPENEYRILKNGKLSFASLKKNPMIYVHWDGYPSGALPILVEFLTSDGARYRINDTEYLSAYYIAWKIIHDFGYTNLKELDDYRSIGIQTECNDWCDYTYIIQKNTITIVKGGGGKFAGDGEILYEFNYNEEKIEDIKDMDWFY